MPLGSIKISPLNGKRESALQVSVDAPSTRLRYAINILTWAVIAWMLSVLASHAFAQVNVNDALQPYRDFKPAEDLATRVMEGLLGESFTSPLTVGLTSNTIFGAIFLVFNVIVFAAGTVFASYGVVSSIVSTAHEGVVLGKRMNAIWMPIRMVTGIGGLVPAFGGFSLSQVAMLLATSLGISFANFAYDKALDAASTTATLTNPSFSRTNPTTDGPAIASALFRQEMCRITEKRKADDSAANGVPLADTNVIKEIPFSSIVNGTTVGRALGNGSDAQYCYAVGIKRKTWALGAVDETGRNANFVLGFRSGAVDYKAINEQAWIGYANNFQELVSRVATLASAYALALDAKTGVVTFPSEEIRAAGIWYTGAVQTYQTAHTTINADALNNMRKYGFFGAGSFYSTHAEVNAAVVQASNVTDFVVYPPRRINPATSGDYDFDYGNPEAALGASTPGQPAKGFCIIGENATGNCSIGQKIIGLVIDAGTAGAGGASTVVDPIIAMKNIGDYLMTLGDTLLALHALGNVGKVAAVVTGVSSSASAVLSAGTTSSASTLLALASTLVLSLGAMLPYIGAALLTIGALCAIYIPMVPFLNWVSALIQYLCIVVESFAAAPLWAFAHLQAEGEGMGQRSERGYLYILNLLFRPILMVIAFFAASGLVILMGSVVFQMYLPTVAAAQGNSVTGIVSVIAYIFLFFVIMNTVIQGLFHLTSELADDAIGWVGGVGKQNIGKETENKVNNLFVAGGRLASGGVTNMARNAGAVAGAGGAKPNAAPVMKSGSKPGDKS